MAVLDSGEDIERPSPRLRPSWRTAAMIAVAAAVCTTFSVFGGASVVLATGGFAVLAVAIAGLSRAPAPSQTGALHRPVEPAGRSRRSLDGRVAVVVSALPDPCMVVNRRGVVVVHNERARHVLPGLRSGDPLSFVLRAPEVIEALAGVMQGGKASSVNYQEKVPIERWFEAHVSPIRMDSASTDMAPDYVVITLRDQTNQQRLERMRVDFVANASHELRTPLASLSGFIETLQGPAKNDVGARERFLEIMRGQALRMSRLIDDLLSLSRIELNAHVLPEATVDLRSIVAQTIDALGPLAHETGVDVVDRLGDTPMEVRGERDELYRVCENLIENAIKYGGAGKQVIVELSRAAAEDGLPPAVLLSVKDNGPGIAEEHIPRLTERFYRVDTVSSREKGGTGLGLAIVKHIVARHRGRLTIDSRIGEGSTFTVRLNEAGKPP